VLLGSIADLASEAFPLLSPFGRWIIHGVRTLSPLRCRPRRSGRSSGKNISLMGFNLEGNLQHVPTRSKRFFKFVVDGTIKVDVPKYPLVDASKAHASSGYRQIRWA